MLIDAREHDGSTPVLLASYAGHDVLVDFLIKRGASYEIQDMDGRTPLPMPLQTIMSGPFRFCLRPVPALASRTVLEGQPFTTCVNGHAEVVQKLISGVRLDGVEDHRGRLTCSWTMMRTVTPLAEAISSGSLRSVSCSLNVACQ